MKPIIIISMDEATGQVKMDAPLDKKLLCLGLLELAKNMVHDHNIPRPNIVTVPTLIPFKAST